MRLRNLGNGYIGTDLGNSEGLSRSGSSTNNQNGSSEDEDEFVEEEEEEDEDSDEDVNPPQAKRPKFHGRASTSDSSATFNLNHRNEIAKNAATPSSDMPHEEVKTSNSIQKSSHGNSKTPYSFRNGVNGNVGF